MANPDNVELVRQGAEATRKWWNEQSPGARLDLHGVDLSGAELHEANLREANLSGAFLVKTNLRRAFLAEANLSHAQLSEADLRQANLHRADLSWAILEQANLRWAYLGGASLYKASLYKVQGAYRAKPRQNCRYVYGWLSRPCVEAPPSRDASDTPKHGHDCLDLGGEGRRLT